MEKLFETKNRLKKREIGVYYIRYYIQGETGINELE